MLRLESRLAALTVAATTLSVTILPDQSQVRAVRAVTDSFFVAAANGQWNAAAALMDTSRFAPYFKTQVERARGELPPPDQTAEDMMMMDPTMPGAVRDTGGPVGYTGCPK